VDALQGSPVSLDSTLSPGETLDPSHPIWAKGGIEAAYSEHWEWIQTQGGKLGRDEKSYSGEVRQMLSAMSELRERRNADARVEQLEARINALLDALDGGTAAVEPPLLEDDA
jgi:hypothetical protein